MAWGPAFHHSPFTVTLPHAPHSPQDPVAPADGLSPLQVRVPWEEDITFPVGEDERQGA